MAYPKAANPMSHSQRVRQHVVDEYLMPARRRGDKTFTVNVGKVQKGVHLMNRVSLVCTALESRQFRNENRLRLVSKTGPPSGQSTTVNLIYEFLDAQPSAAGQDAWTRLRGALKDVFAELGGGDNYLRKEREQFHGVDEDR